MIGGDSRGFKGDSPHWGRLGQAAAPRLPSGLVQNPPASPPLQGQSLPGRGGALPQGRARSGASGAAGKGLWLVLVFLLSRFGRGTGRVEGKWGRPVSVRKSNLAPGPGVRFCF